MHLALTHFNSLRGPVVFLSEPAALPEEAAKILLRLLDITDSGDFFTFDTRGNQNFRLVNCRVEIPSEWARGNVELVLISGVFEQEVDAKVMEAPLKQVAAALKEAPCIYKGFYEVHKQLDVSTKRAEIERILREGFTAIETKMDQMKIASGAFQQRPVTSDSNATQVAQIFNKVFISTIDARHPQGAAVLYEAGTVVGQNIVPLFEGNDLEEIINQIAGFWKKYALGKVEDVEIHPGKIHFNVYECFECSHYPNIGKTVCKFDEGVLTSLLSKKLRRSVLATETECFGTGHDHCCFVLEIAPPEPRKF